MRVFAPLLLLAVVPREYLEDSNFCTGCHKD